MSDTTVQFLTRNQVLVQIGKTMHAERNGFILKELLHAIGY